MRKVKPSVTHPKWLSLTRSYGVDGNSSPKLFYVECCSSRPCWELKNLTGWVLHFGIGRSPHPCLSFSLFPASMYVPTTMLFHLATGPETMWLRTLKCELNSSVPFNSLMPRVPPPHGNYKSNYYCKSSSRSKVRAVNKPGHVVLRTS